MMNRGSTAVIPEEYEDLHDPEFTRLAGKDAANRLDRSLREFLERIHKNSAFYRKKLAAAGFKPQDFKGVKDLAALPFTTKEELREIYPLGLQAVPDRDVIRIHSSSGTTGKPIIIPYTRKDVADWAVMFARCYAFAGVTRGTGCKSPRVTAFGPLASGFRPAANAWGLWRFPWVRVIPRSNSR